MAYWFHRNPLKSTVKVNFDLKMVTASPDSVQICSELKRNRDILIEHFADPNSNQENMEKTLQEYLGLLMGFVRSNDRGGDSSKLRHSIRFKWTQSLLGNNPIVQQDSMYELISICQEYGIWLMKHGGSIAGKEELSMDDAKKLHKCLRKAAGVFKKIQSEFVDRLLEKPDPGSDMDPRVSNAYILQCTAEAQEVTIARAMELKHSASLISGLANETSRTFLAAASSIKALDMAKFAKWLHYFRLKSELYLALAYCYLGDNLLEQEKCGDAIKALEESEKALNGVMQLSKEYSKMKGPGVGAKLEQHLFFRKLRPLILRIKEKCLRENGMIFHQKVATEVPKLEIKATHGIVSPEEFNIPDINPMWSSAYSSFDLTKNINPKDPANSSAAIKAEGPLPPMKEKEVPQTNKDPKNNSGCHIQ